MFVKDNHFLFLVALFTFLQSGPLNAFDCRKTAATDEKIICHSETLKNYDAAMSKLYSSTLNSLGEDDKRKLIASQHAWLNERIKQQDKTKLSGYYLQKVRSQCKIYEKICKSLTEKILKKWQVNGKKLKAEDSIIISSYLKGNLNNYVNDKKDFKEIEDDIK